MFLEVSARFVRWARFVFRRVTHTTVQSTVVLAGGSGESFGVKPYSHRCTGGLRASGDGSGVKLPCFFPFRGPLPQPQLLFRTSCSTSSLSQAAEKISAFADRSHVFFSSFFLFSVWIFTAVLVPSCMRGMRLGEPKERGGVVRSIAACFPWSSDC